MTITDFINTILEPNIAGIPTVFIIAGIIFLFWIIYKRQKKPDEFKAINVGKEIRKDLDELFKLSKENTGMWLKSGVVNLGYILESVKLPLRADKDLKTEIKSNNPKSIESVKKQITQQPDEKVIKAYAFKIASKSLIRRLIQKGLKKFGFNFGLKYVIAEESILTFSEYNISINPYCTPIYYFKVWSYSPAGFEFIETIAIKLKHQLLVDSLVNTVPKQTYLEINQSKQMEQLNAIAKIKKDRQKEMLEEIKKGNV